MAYERNPNDPYRANDPHRANDPYRANPADDDIRQAARLDSELQPDPELAEGPAGGPRVAMYAIAIAVVLGAVFYGLNNSSINKAGTSSTAQNSSQTSAPAAPRANTNPGTTTGAAPQTSPANNPPANK
jgi:cell division septation protein DedD